MQGCSLCYASIYVLYNDFALALYQFRQLSKLDRASDNLVSISTQLIPEGHGQYLEMLALAE